MYFLIYLHTKFQYLAYIIPGQKRSEFHWALRSSWARHVVITDCREVQMPWPRCCHGNRLEEVKTSSKAPFQFLILANCWIQVWRSAALPNAWFWHLTCGIEPRQKWSVERGPWPSPSKCYKRDANLKCQRQIGMASQYFKCFDCRTRYFIHCEIHLPPTVSPTNKNFRENAWRSLFFKC
jgi:hypothetical protein